MSQLTEPDPSGTHPGATEGGRPGLTVSRGSAAFLVLVGAWTWAIWPNFLRNIGKDPRSFDQGRPTAFFLVHLVLTVASLVIGTITGGIGIRAWRGSRRG
ncbi:MAG: SCO4848 family membrane protein [Actinomycetes bacterium]